MLAFIRVEIFVWIRLLLLFVDMFAIPKILKLYSENSIRDFYSNRKYCIAQMFLGMFWVGWTSGMTTDDKLSRYTILFSEFHWWTKVQIVMIKNIVFNRIKYSNLTFDLKLILNKWLNLGHYYFAIEGKSLSEGKNTFWMNEYFRIRRKKTNIKSIKRIEICMRPLIVKVNDAINYQMAGYRKLYDIFPSNTLKQLKTDMKYIVRSLILPA